MWMYILSCTRTHLVGRTFLASQKSHHLITARPPSYQILEPTHTPPYSLRFEPLRKDSKHYEIQYINTVLVSPSFSFALSVSSFPLSLFPSLSASLYPISPASATDCTFFPVPSPTFEKTHLAKTPPSRYRSWRVEEKKKKGKRKENEQEREKKKKKKKY